MKPSAEDLAKLAIETLDAQKAFFRSAYQSPERTAALNKSICLEKLLREAATEVLKPRTLFDRLSDSDSKEAL